MGIQFPFKAKQPLPFLNPGGSSGEGVDILEPIFSWVEGAGQLEGPPALLTKLTQLARGAGCSSSLKLVPKPGPPGQDSSNLGIQNDGEPRPSV